MKKEKFDEVIEKLLNISKRDTQTKTISLFYGDGASCRGENYGDKYHSKINLFLHFIKGKPCKEIKDSHLGYHCLM